MGCALSLIHIQMCIRDRTTAILRQHVQMDDTKVLAEMDKYIRKLEQQSQKSRKKAKSEAEDALKRTGVINRNGALKKVIVSWE